MIIFITETIFRLHLIGLYAYYFHMFGTESENCLSYLRISEVNYLFMTT
jgi:hypothetical protein